MKKGYLNFDKYLFNYNTADGAAGSSSQNGGDTNSNVGELGDDPALNANAAGEGKNGSAKDWRDFIPAELKEHPRFKDAESLESILKAHAEFKEAPGIPESYNLPKGAPEQLGEWAKTNNLTQEQFDSVVKLGADLDQAKLTATLESHKAGMKELAKRWGDSAKANLNLANRVLEYADPEGKLGLVKFLQGPESGYAAQNPMIIELFYNMAVSMKEGGVLKGETPSKNDQTKKVNPAHDMYPEQTPEKMGMKK